MGWVYLILVVHLLFGLGCAYLAHEAKQKAEPWFLAGTLLGGLALIVWLIFKNERFYSASA